MYSIMRPHDYFLCQFPESLFPCHIEMKNEYKERIINGLGVASASKVAICGTAKNLGAIVHNTIARLNYLSGMFYYCDFFIYENDSTDGTTEELQKWADLNNSVNLMSERLGKKQHAQDTSLYRRQIMAYARNKYLQAVRDSGTDYDYVIVVDMDLEGGWSYDGIMNSFGWKDLWDVIGSNGLIYKENNGELQQIFYDAWAFRKLGHYMPHKNNDINLLCYNRGERPIRCFSVFGGLAIYKSECILGNKFVYNDDDCDHPTLNKKLTLRGKTIWLNPSMISIYSKTDYTC